MKNEIMELIERFGMIDGSHHKQWILDQIVRKIKGDEYETWLKYFNEDEDYLPWDEGIAP